jgi:hypothetical protein
MCKVKKFSVDCAVGAPELVDVTDTSANAWISKTPCRMTVPALPGVPFVDEPPTSMTSPPF